ncbi:MAG TPA: SDR family NAD(P)-dependent oxidoreductase [Acidimicrobiia bacterium]|nr:SDR family NAD(P)-dependent oxidoreductase [Acidimicrobiia bacterium]
MTTFAFDGRVAVVTGAARGIGRAYAELLAARGAKVVVNDLGGTTAGTGHDPEPARAAAADITAAGGTAVPDAHDVASADGGAALIETALEQFGRVDVVVNNAGNVLWGDPTEATIDTMQSQLAVHVLGAFNTTRAVWPHMLERGYGRIVLTTSTGMFGLPDNLGYATAKAAMIGMAKSLTAAAGDRDIKINVIAPNAATRMGMRDAPPVETPPPNMHPALVAPMVGFLAHESCPVSGEVYVAGAGRFGRVFVAANDGYLHDGAEPPTIEDVAEHWPTIRDETDFYVPASLSDWAARFMSHLRDELSNREW